MIRSGQRTTFLGINWDARWNNRPKTVDWVLPSFVNPLLIKRITSLVFLILYLFCLTSIFLVCVHAMLRDFNAEGEHSAL